MGSSTASQKPHAVCIPYPAQGHVTPMLKLAKLLHSQGFYITFVNTEFNHRRLLNSRAAESLHGLPDFRFDTIPDGLPPSDADATQDVPALCHSLIHNCSPFFRDLLQRLNEEASSSGAPPVSIVVGDGVMTFTFDAAEELGIPEVLFWTASTCGCMGYMHYRHLIERGLTPLKDSKDLRNGYLDTPIDWILGLKNMRLRDIPSFIQTTDPNDIMLNFFLHETKRLSMAKAIIINTFDDLEHSVLDAIQSILPPIYTIGPLPLILSQYVPKDSPLASIGSSLWKEEGSCLEWLDGREGGSVILVSFGSITTMTKSDLIEFAWGLANSGHPFLWVIRRDLLKGDEALLPQGFVEETKGRSLIVSWCPQEKVLAHRSIGGFLTHNGWNSTIESISVGVPMLCWPFFAEQQTNCRYACTEWGIGMEIGDDVKRKVVERLIRELMGGEKGNEMRNKALEWKESAVRATQPGGTSFKNFGRVVNEVLLPLSGIGPN